MVESTNGAIHCHSFSSSTIHHFGRSLIIISNRLTDRSLYPSVQECVSLRPYGLKQGVVKDSHRLSNVPSPRILSDRLHQLMLIVLGYADCAEWAFDHSLPRMESKFGRILIGETLSDENSHQPAKASVYRTVNSLDYE
jgi:hypothetical protein